jgi:DNA-binding NtrC family response regulator
MNLQSLLVCSDERILRVLRRVLDELAIEMEHCADRTAATELLARQTFEAVIIDCAEEGNLSLLKSIRMRQRNKKVGSSGYYRRADGSTQSIRDGRSFRGLQADFLRAGKVEFPSS